MDNNIVSLKISEVPIMHPDALWLLQAEMGLAASQEVIERAALELGDRVWMLEKALDENAFDEVRRIAVSMVSIAEQIGLSGFAQVSRDVSDCAAAGSDLSLHATVCRLRRVGDASFYKAVQFSQNA